MLRRHLPIRALLSGAAFLAAAYSAPADAQRIDRIVAFGDSYADDGNAFQLAGIDPLTTGVYTTGRFSGGTNYVDTLAFLLGVPVENFAIGGARTNTGNQTFGLPGFTSEVQFFLAGGGPAAFPRVTPTFDEGDLVTISIGGNDARAYQQGGGTVAGAPASAATAVGFAATGINSLVVAGAPTISFLAGDTSRLPEVNFYADPTGARTVRQAYSTAFNTGIQNVLAGHAANGVIVHYLDLTTILNQIEANLAAYGFTGIACPAFPAPIGPGVPGSTACVPGGVANNFVFYGDQLHLTSAGFAVVARYVAAQLQAPLTLQGTSDLALDTARHFGRTLSTRVDLSAPRDGDLAEGMQFFVVGDSYSRDVEADQRTDQFDIDSTGVTAGLAFGFGNGTVGIAANLSRPKANFIGDVAETEGKTLQVGAFAGFAIAGAFAQGHLGYGKDDHDLSRQGVVNGMTASTDGNHWVAGAKAGYLMPMGAMRIGPVVGLDYATAKVDGYTEEGDAALNLIVDDVSAKAMSGSLGVELRGDLAGGGVQLRPFAAATIEKDFLGDERTVRFAQTTSPTIVNQWQLERSKKAYGRIAAGASAAILDRATLNIALSSTLGKKEGDEVSAHLGLRVGF